MQQLIFSLLRGFFPFSSCTAEAKSTENTAAKRAILRKRPQKRRPASSEKSEGAGRPAYFQNASAETQPFSTFGVLFFSMTSWLPPSTMLVEETTVRRAFSCSSGMESAPQLHMVLLTL